MDQKSLLPLLFFLLTSSSELPSFSNASNHQYMACTPSGYNCGASGVVVRYPFWFNGSPDYCGYPGFKLSCNDNNNLTIHINGKEYQVRDIDYSSKVLVVVDQTIVDQTCPQPDYNADVSLSVFEYSDNDSNLGVFFNCTPPSSSYAKRRVFACPSTNSSYYTVDKNSSAEMSDKCTSKVLVPVRQTAADLLEYGKLNASDVYAAGFSLRWMKGGEGWCDSCVNSGGACGYNATSPSEPTCFCPNAPNSLPCPPGNGDAGVNLRKKIIVGIATGLGSLLVGSIFFSLQRWYYGKKCEVPVMWNKTSENSQTVEDFLERHGSLAPKRYAFSEVRKMTKSFNEKLGQGGYGSVFKGELFDGSPVAVKILRESSKSDGAEFVNEVVAIAKTSHVNVVSLVGFSIQGSKRALIYEFMPNGSLDKHIHESQLKASNPDSLGWRTLYEIAVGIARGLEYLHSGCNTPMVHFDIKPHNILLDQDFRPKISDFGLAKLCRPKESILSISGARGTIGYIAPEVFSRNFGAISSKSDVYSYGMMVLDMVGGRRRRKNEAAAADNSDEAYFPQWIYEQLEVEDGEDVGNSEVASEDEEMVRKLMIVGLWCIQIMPQKRPSMSRVLDMLQGSTSSTSLEIPPKPTLSSPLQQLTSYSNISTTTQDV
ncbi:LEAF RUST 10 DISEASE-RESISTANCEUS RECEPTOR-LIKE PROTEIN KINASE-like 2.1 [Typha angustifolia]|uniref:LEAF RUST 10 DISEASE-RESISTANCEUS RECEPTOR-LIKE PROTEIN KINASE-like 2.1 n=1 Tax=Typha angustifolia TaxID=59011 RepID=UPI003C2F2429